MVVGVTASAALFLLASGVASWAFWPRVFDRPPEPRALRDKYLALAEDETRLVVLDSMLEGYIRNEVVIGLNLRAFKWSFLLSAAAVVLLGIAVILQLLAQAKVLSG